MVAAAGDVADLSAQSTIQIMSSDSEAGGRHRIDKWLWHVRLFKARSQATDAVNGGRVKLDGERVKPAHPVRVGQQVSVTFDARAIEVTVLAMPPRRGPATQAQACYAETADSVARSTQLREERRLAALTRPQPDHRPDKRERRQLDRLRRQQG